MSSSSRPATPLRAVMRPLVRLLLIAGAAGVAAPGQAQLVQVSQLKDVAFGIVGTASAVSRSQNVCVEMLALVNYYSVTATGSGTDGSFRLADGANTLAYDVQWSDATNQTVGTALVAGRATGNFAAGSCVFGLTTSASLITAISLATLTGATAGTYRGTLTLLIAPQ
jgi:hypothetical protein